jgi:hypothetical protein
MKSLALEPGRVKFPARCAGCGASPSRDVTLEAWRGKDLLVIRWGHYCEVPIPMCQRCWSRRWRNRILWFVALPLAIVAVIGLMVVLSQQLGDETTPWVMGSLVAVLSALVLFARGREQEWFQQLTSPVWLRRWKPNENRVELCFRDEKLAEEVAVLSGLMAPPQREANYRESAVSAPPPAWSGPRPRQIPWWSGLIVAALFFIVAIVEFVQYSDFERTGSSLSDQALFVFIYDLGGKWALSGFLCVFGVGFCVASFVYRHFKSQRTEIR